MLACFSLSVYGLVIGLLVVRILRTSEIWLVTGWLIPLILLSSGIYIPLVLIPEALQYFAYTTPVPYLMELTKLVLIYRAMSRVTIIQFLIYVLSLYLISTIVLSRSCEIVIKREGTLCWRRM